MWGPVLADNVGIFGWTSKCRRGRPGNESATGYGHSGFFIDEKVLLAHKSRRSATMAVTINGSAAAVIEALKSAYHFNGSAVAMIEALDSAHHQWLSCCK